MVLDGGKSDCDCDVQQKESIPSYFCKLAWDMGMNCTILNASYVKHSSLSIFGVRI